MTFSCIKQEDTRRPAKYHVKSYNSDGSLAGEWDRSSIGNRIGSLRVSMFNRTKNYKPGRFSVNPFEARSCTGKCNKSYLELHYRWGGRTYVSRRITGDVMGYFSSPTWDITYGIDFDTWAKEYTHTKAFAKMNAPDLDVGTPLGELRETFGSLVSPLKGARSLLLKMAAKAPRSKKRALKYLSDAWLEYRYDVMPNVLTASDIISYIEQKKRSLTSLERRTSLHRSPVKVVKVVGTSDLEGYPLEWRSTVATTTSTVCRVFFQLKTDKADLGVSVYDIPRVAWELIPYSFVVDWFFGVGDWLTAHRDIGDRVLLGCTHSAKFTSTYEVRGLAIYNPYISPAKPEIHVPGSYLHTTSKFIRSTGDSDLPSLPMAKHKWLNVNQLADSVALSLAYLPKSLTYHRR